MSSRYYATVYDIVKPIATFLHPIRVEGLAVSYTHLTLPTICSV